MASKDVQMTFKINDEASATLNKIAATAGSAFGKIEGIIAGAGMAAPLTLMIKQAEEWGASVQDLVEKTGMAEESAGKLLVVGKVVGLTAEEVESAFVKMSKSVSAAQDAINKAADGTEKTSNVFSRFGIAIMDSSRNLLPAEQILKNIIEVHRKLPDGIEKTNMELEIFGKKGAKLYDMLNMPAAEMDRLIEKFTKLGLVSSGTADKWKEINIKTRELELSFKAVGVSLGNEMLPRVTKTMEELNHLVEQFGQLDEVQKQLVISSGKFAAEFGALNVLILNALPWWGKLAAVIGLVAFNMDDVVKKMAAEAYAKDYERQFGKGGDWEGGGLNTGQNKDYNKQANKGAKDDERAAATIKTAQDLSLALEKIRENSLSQALININKELAEFRKSKLDEVKITQYAEEAKSKAVRDAIEKRMGAEVAAVKQAILEGKSIDEAYETAKAGRLKDEKAKYDAVEYVRNREGIRVPGEKVTDLTIDKSAGTIMGTRRTVTDVYVPERKGMNNPFDAYRERPSGTISITVSPTINIKGLTDEDERRIFRTIDDGMRQALGQAENAKIDARY